MRCSFLDPFCCVSLNNKKAVDEFGLLAEHLIHSGIVLVVIEITCHVSYLIIFPYADRVDTDQAAITRAA